MEMAVRARLCTWGHLKIYTLRCDKKNGKKIVEIDIFI